MSIRWTVMTVLLSEFPLYREEGATPCLICPLLWWDVTSPVANREPVETHGEL